MTDDFEILNILVLILIIFDAMVLVCSFLSTMSPQLYSITAVHFFPLFELLPVHVAYILGVPPFSTDVQF